MALELKYPRNGQFPEQMFSFCKDLSFCEELVSEGFKKAAVVIFAQDRPFYHGSSDGIYGYFRGGKTLHGRITKPTGSKDTEIFVSGSYTVVWKPVVAKLMYTVIEVNSASCP